MQGVSSKKFDHSTYLDNHKMEKVGNLRTERRTMSVSSAEQATEELLYVLYNETVDHEQVTQFFENWDDQSQQVSSTSRTIPSSENATQVNFTTSTVDVVTTSTENQDQKDEITSSPPNEIVLDESTKTPTTAPETNYSDGMGNGIVDTDNSLPNTRSDRRKRWSLKNFFKSDRWTEILIISAWGLFLFMFCGCACLAVVQRRRRRRQINREDQVQWSEGAWVTILGQGLAGTTIVGTDRQTKKIQILLAEALEPGKVFLKDYNFCTDDDDLEDQISYCHRSTAAMEDCTSIDVSSLAGGSSSSHSSRSSGRSIEPSSPSRKTKEQQQADEDGDLVEDMQTGAIFRRKDIVKEQRCSSASAIDDTGNGAVVANSQSKPATKKEPMVIIPSIFALKRKHQVVQNECVICMDKLRPGQEVSVSPFVLCNHVFHADCIFTWCLHQLKENQLSSAETDLSQMRRGRDFAQNSANCPCCRQTFVVIQKLGMRHNDV